MSVDLLQQLKTALSNFQALPLAQASSDLWRLLGYHSNRTPGLASLTEVAQSNPAIATTEVFGKLREATKSFEVLFQLTAEDLRAWGGQRLLQSGPYDGQIIESFLFACLELNPKQSYSRTQLANFTRVLNQFFPMPLVVLFKHPDIKNPHTHSLTIAAAERRVNQRDSSKDVVERKKVTLIKDINCINPHRAHLEILLDLHLQKLSSEKALLHIAELDRAWRKTLDTNALNERFYKELANWFYWAAQDSKLWFPNLDKEKPKDPERTKAVHLHLIRLITRLVFVWFLKEKQLVPPQLFEPSQLRGALKNFDPQHPADSTYYQAILQNLFFATLNTPMGDERGFKDDHGGYNPGYMVHTRYRYKSAFQDAEQVLAWFAKVPFLNGGLFECLDTRDNNQELRIDGFSDVESKRAKVPNLLFFADWQRVNLDDDYGTKGKRYQARGLIELLQSYKFTVDENTPIEEEVALDPELLGKVFENLLAAYNPETKETARRELGAFYTPRYVVDFMVDESLLEYLYHQLSQGQAAQVPGQANQAALLYPANPQQLLNQGDHLRTRLRYLLSFAHDVPTFTPQEIERIIKAIDNCKIIDPACGSGAFPLGVLQKLVHVLERLDPQGESWKAQQEAKLQEELKNDRRIQDLHLDLQTIERIKDEQLRTEAQRAAIKEIQDRKQALAKAFDLELTEPNYARKLYLIENCIYGVDLEPIAVQIAKLRCFIALVVDQKTKEDEPNWGVLPLPNLETKFVAANTLLPLEQAQALKPPQVFEAETQLNHVRHLHFRARTYQEKSNLRQRDQTIRDGIAQALKDSGFSSDDADQIARFNPYDQSASAPFFDPEWMFGWPHGFDIVIGNPPYVRQERIDTKLKVKLRPYKSFVGTADLYVYFFERGLRLLKEGGWLCYICSNKYFRSAYGQKLRTLLATTTQVSILIDFGDAPVFKAIAYPSILLTQQAKAKTNHYPFKTLIWNPKDNTENFREVFAAKAFDLDAKESLQPDGWRIENQQTLELLKQIRQAGVPLGEFVKGRFYRGVLTGFNEAFVIDKDTRDRLIAQHPSSAEVIKPFLRGRDVKRWRIDHAEQYLIKIESSENKAHPWSGHSPQEAENIFAQTLPAIYARFSSADYRQALVSRSDQGRYYWELRSCVYWQEFEKPKIVYPDIAASPRFALDFDGIYLGNTAYFIPTHQRWLCALLNSKPVEWFYGQISATIRGGFFRAFSDYIGQIPVPSVKAAAEQLLTQLVDITLLLARHPEHRGILLYMERIIDALAYELYLPKALHAAGRFPLQTVAAVRWPALTANEDQNLRALQSIYEEVYHPQHPVRKLVYFLDSVDEIRVIEDATAGETSTH